MTRVVAPSRLHFGLLSLPGNDSPKWTGIDGGTSSPIRHFGGVGLMVDRPGLTVRVEDANEWSADGPLASRAMEFARQFVESLPTNERRPFRVMVEDAPAQHSGLGVGTQLALAVARAIAVESGHGDWKAVELAQRVGRGERSAIGIHGFESGGLIVEGGKTAGEAVAPLVARFAFPADWAVVLFTPPGRTDWHGGRERDAFARLGPNLAQTNELCRIVLMGLLPALVSADLDAFGEALYEFNVRAGGLFAPVQGGCFASSEVAACVARLRSAGVRGVGQSSWGPTVFAITRREDAEEVRKVLLGIPAQVASAFIAP
jgi:beta-ribofuranosylaminobenzene 5'-phosphate synthase